MASKQLLTISIAGQGSPLILIHGVAGSLHIWDPIVGELAKNNMVVRMDLLGYGHSPKPHVTYTPYTHVQAIRETLIANDIKPPYTLIGLSMGVNLALEYAARWPEEVHGFIGIGFPYYPNEKAARKGLHNNTWTRLTIEYPPLAQIVIPIVWGLARHGILPAESFSKIYSPLMAKETMLNPYYVFKSSVWNTMVHNPQTKLLEKSRGLKRLFIHGTEDVWASPEDVDAAIKPYSESQLKIIPDIGHNVVVLAPKITAKYVIEYVNRIFSEN